MTRPARPDLLALAALTAAVVAVLTEALLRSDAATPVLSAAVGDTRLLFAPWRALAGTHLAAGDIPLWNPYVFCGAPFLAGFQSALLYPPTWIHAVLPLDVGLNLELGFHLWLAGAFTYAWARHRGCGPTGALLAALVATFGGRHYWELAAGHAAHLAAMAWTPAVLLACDACCDRPSVRWWTAGALAATLQLLAGFPQHLYYTALAAQLLVVLRLATDDDRRWPLLLLPASIFGAAALLGAAQLLPALDAAAESVRAHGVSRQFGGTFSFPPEGLLTAIAPGLFGQLPPDYWGRWVPWDADCYVGATACLLAVVGLLAHRRRALVDGALLLAFTLVALGHYTPLFGLLYDLLPGFDRFRAHGRALWIAHLALALLAGRGLTSLAGYRGHRLALAAGAVALGLATLSFAGDASLADAVAGLGGGDDAFWQPAALDGPRVAADVRASVRLAALALALAAVGLGLPRHRAILLLTLAALELLVFARGRTPTFDLALARMPDAARALIDADDRGARLLWLSPLDNDLGATTGHPSAWGYGPDARLRVARLMHFAQTGETGSMPEYLRLTRVGPALAPMRVGWVIARSLPGHRPERSLGRQQLYRLDTRMPRATLVDGARVVPDVRAALAHVGASRFDPARAAVLETSPVLAPRPRPGRVVSVEDRGPDRLEIAVALERPGLLVLSESYASGWTARDADTGAALPIQPANVAFRAVALPAETRRIVMEYTPAAWTTGRALSLIAWLALGGALLWRRRRCAT